MLARLPVLYRRSSVLFSVSDTHVVCIASILSLTALPFIDRVRVTFIKVLGVTFTSHLSVSDHLGDVIRKCAQSLYAVKVLGLRFHAIHGMSDEKLRLVY